MPDHGSTAYSRLGDTGYVSPSSRSTRCTRSTSATRHTRRSPASSSSFLYWPPAGLVVVPFGQQAVAMHVSRAGIDELGRIAHTQARQSQLPQIDRSVIIGKALLTVSSAGVAANALAGLHSLGWTPFPAPAQGPTPAPLPGG
jgi:hypothetical protein